MMINSDYYKDVASTSNTKKPHNRRSAHTLWNKTTRKALPQKKGQQFLSFSQSWRNRQVRGILVPSKAWKEFSCEDMWRIRVENSNDNGRRRQKNKVQISSPPLPSVSKHIILWWISSRKFTSLSLHCSFFCFCELCFCCCNKATECVSVRCKNKKKLRYKCGVSDGFFWSRAVANNNIVIWGNASKERQICKRQYRNSRELLQLITQKSTEISLEGGPASEKRICLRKYGDCRLL